MNREFIPYEQAIELKHLGFEEPCFGAWVENELFIPEKQNPSIQSLSNNQCIAPLYQQAFRFFREKYNILATIYSNASGYLYEWHDAVVGTHRGWSEYNGPNDGGVWDSYEQAEHACLLKLIELAKQK